LVRILRELLPYRSLFSLAARLRLRAFARLPGFRRFCAGAPRYGERLRQLHLQAFQFLTQRRCGVFGLRRGDKAADLAFEVFSKRLVEPDRDFSGDLERGEGEGMVVSMGMGRLIAGDADLMEKVHHLRRDRALDLQPSQQVRLRLFWRGKEAVARSNFLCEKL